MELPPPYEDRLSGACLRLDRLSVLLTGGGWQTAALPGEILAQGELAVRYAFPFLHDVGLLVPQLVYDDHRESHSGRELFRFVIARGNAYPRADVMGVRLTGQEEHARLRDLDLGRPLVPVLTHEGVSLPIEAAIVVDDAASALEVIDADSVPADLPALLVQHVGCFRVHADAVSGLRGDLEP